MGNPTANHAKGEACAWARNVQDNTPPNSAILVFALQVAEADTVLEDYDTWADVLAGANTVADFTGYIPLVLTDIEISVVEDDTANEKRIECNINPQWLSAGGANNDDLVKIAFGYVPDSTSYTPSDVKMISYPDFTVTTNGNNLTCVLTSNTIYTAH